MLDLVPWPTHQILSEDYSKLAVLRSDRTIELHSKNGHYYSTRIPKVINDVQLSQDQVGRDMMYNYSTCDIITCGATPFINRINLERGCFLKPMESSCPNLNVPIFCSWHNPIRCVESIQCMVCMDLEEKME